MSVRVHNILTGELESSYLTSVFGAPERHPLVKKEELLPYGHRERKYNRDGTFEPGLMVPVPVWFIEGADSRVLIDTGLGDVKKSCGFNTGMGSITLLGRVRIKKYAMA